MKKSIFNAVCKTRYLALLVLLIFTCGNAWADYTITFATQSGTDGTTALTTKETAVTAGGDYISTWSSGYVYKGGSNAGMKFGSGSYVGYVTMTMTTSGTYVGQIKASKITFKQAKKSDDCSISYTITYTDATTTTGTQALTATATDYDISLTSSKTIQTIDIRSTAKKKRFYLQAITITAAGGAVSHTLSSAVSPAAGGSVSLGATSVAEGSTTTATATPNSGYVFSSWSISGTGASLSSTTDNPTTVTMGTANATVTANFAAKTAASISFVNAGTPAPTTSGYYVGDSYTLPSTNNYSCNGKTFVGWSTVPVAETDIKPTSNFYEPGASATLAASQTFYAVFASVTEGTGDWEQCSSSTIADGDYLIVQSDYMMTNTLNSQRFNRTYIAISAGVISYDAKADWSAYTWHIAETSTSGIFTIKNGNNYVIGTGTASKIDLVSTPADDKELFAITYQSTPGTYKIVSKYNEAASVNRWLRNGGSYFACYADGGYPYLFKRGSGYGNYCTTCAVTHTVSAVVDPAGKATVTLGATTVAEDATTTAEYSGITTGYEFVNWSISGTGASLSSTTSNPTTITMGTANVTVTANLRCITPSISVQPAASTSCLVGASPELSVTAAAGGASLSYQWKQCATIDGVYSNVASGGTSSTYSPSTASAGTTYYKCVITNAASGCSANVTSDPAQVTVNAGSTWKFKYSGDSYTAHTMSESDGVASYSVSLAADTRYEFGFDDNGSAFYKNQGTIITTTSGWVFNTLDNNCKIHTGPAGTYTFAINTTTKAVTVTYPTVDHPNDHYVYFKNTSVWGTVKGYLGNTGNDNKAAAWPGSDMQATTTICNETYHYAALNAMSGTYNVIIFNNGDGAQTSDLSTTGSLGKYNANQDANWHQFKYTISFAGNGNTGGSMTDVEGICPGGSETLAANAYTRTGYTFANWKTDVAITANSSPVAANGDVPGGATISSINSDITLTAQWTANTISLTLDKNNNDAAGSTSGSGSIDYDATSGTITTAPTRTGHSVEGYYSDAACTAANKVLDASGNVINSTVSGYTTSGKWTRATTPTTLYTKWTPNNYTVTWYAGGTDAGNITTEGSPTTSVAYGSKVTTLPTDPDGAACDKTFVGWTNTTSYTHGTSLLFTDAAGSSTITGVTNFYAVYATGGATEYVLTPAASLSAGRYVIAAYDDSNSKFVALTGAVSAVSTGSNSDMVNETTGFTISEGKFTSLPTGACEFVLTAYTGETDEGFYIQNPADDKYLDYQDGASGTNRRLWFYAATDYVDEYDNPTTPWAAWYGVALSKEGFPDNGMYLKYVDESYSLMSNGSSTSFVRGYANDNTKYKPIYLFKKTGGLSGYTITCADCGTSVTPTYTAAPTDGTVSVTKSAAAVASGSTVKTCTSVDLTVTITPASHYTLTGFTATGLSTGTATISPAVGSTLPKTTETTFTVTVSSGATGTLNLTPTFTEDTKVAITWNVNGVNQSIAATEGLTWVYSGEDLTALPSTPSVPAGCSGTKVFAGWSQKHSDATEQDAAWYDDLFDAYDDPTVPTGITTAKTFYAVFATSSSNPLAGTVMWDEPWTGTSDKTTPTSPSSGATVYNSTVLTYAYTNGNTTTQVYADGTMYSGGAAAPELLISKTSPSGVWTVTNIPTGGSAQTELTLSYKTNKTTIAVTSGTSGITIGDPTVDGNTYTHTITINHSPSTINNFSLIFTNTGSSNARLDDIHLVVPGSGTMTDYVTLCAPSWTITYDKNTSDPVTNLPSPTSVLQSTGSGTLSSTVPERATYTFSGWATTAGGNVAYAAGGSINGVSADMDLYAVWEKTPIEELFLNYSELNKYVGDPAVTLEVTGVTPEGADATVTWSSNNSSVASVVAATGVVTFGTVGTATITATSTVTGTTTAYCYVTVRNKPTASFTDLIHDGNGTDLSTYHMQNVAGTAIVFPTLDDYATPGDDCDSKHYIFVGWTTSDNNDDPEDHLVTSDELEDDQDKVFYAVWADGVEGVSYTKLTTSTFKTSPTKYVIGAIDGDDTFYFYSCAATDANNGNGGCTNAPGTNAPIQFTLSGTADALVATSTEATARYLTPLTAKNFQMSATSQTIQLNDDGTIANPSDDSWTLRFNTSEDYLRWYSSATGNAAYFYEVTAGAAVSYRTSCCTNNVPAPTVVATNTAYTVTLTWAAVDGATGYEVSWNGGAFEAATSPCVKSGLTASTDYTYKVRATYDPLVKCGALVASGNVTTDDVYSVTYSGGTGTGSCSPSGSVAPASYEAGATVTLAPTNSFSLTSNTFAAWVVKDADDNDVPVSNNQFTMPAKNVTVTATWTAVQDKYYDRMHDGTDASHGGIADGEGKYYLVREGCNYTVPTLTDDDDGDTDCHTTHFKLLGWIAYSHLKTDGSGQIKPGEESYIFQGGGTKSATGATYYAVWAIMTE